MSRQQAYQFSNINTVPVPPGAGSDGILIRTKVS